MTITQACIILAIMNRKGGVGKTTICRLIAEYLVLVYNLKVLLIDTDPQCNLTDHFVGMEADPDREGGQVPPIHPQYDPNDPTFSNVNPRSSIADIYYGKEVLPYESYLTESECNGGYLDVLCGHPKLLEDVNLYFKSKGDRLDEKVLLKMRNVVRSPHLMENYNFILQDTGPTQNPLNRAILRSTNSVVVPFKPETKDVQGINSMIQFVVTENYFRENDDQVKLIGLLPNMYRVQDENHEKTINDMFNKFPEQMFPKEAFISLSKKYPDRDIKGARPSSIFELPPSNKLRKQSTKMCEYILSSMNIKIPQREVA